MGGSRSWIVIALSIAGVRALKRMGSSEHEILYRTVVKPGDLFEIDVRPPPKR
jgi:hypothetical protein